MEHLGRRTCGARRRVLPLKRAQRCERGGRRFLSTTRTSWFSSIVPDQLVGKPDQQPNCISAVVSINSTE